MINVENLKSWGANTEEALKRCMNNEAVYLKLIEMFLANNSFNELKEALASDDLEKAFHASHALKGVLGNLSLTPLYDIIFETTELLRSRAKTDYSDLLSKYEKSYAELLALR